MSDNNHDTNPVINLEPRVVKLETGLEILTRDVSNLAQVVREQSRNIEHEIQKLAIGVTQAAAPRTTDWRTIISALFLVMAIGSAVFWPLNQTVTGVKQESQSVAAEFRQHEQLQLHPVGASIVNRLESQFLTYQLNNEKALQYQERSNNEKLAAFSKSIEIRLNKLEKSDDERTKAELDELRSLKLKLLQAFPLNSPK